MQGTREIQANLEEKSGILTLPNIRFLLSYSNWDNGVRADK